MTKPKKFEAILIQAGIPNANGNVYSEEAVKSIAAQCAGKKVYPRMYNPTGPISDIPEPVGEINGGEVIEHGLKVDIEINDSHTAAMLMEHPDKFSVGALTSHVIGDDTSCMIDHTFIEGTEAKWRCNMGILERMRAALPGRPVGNESHVVTLTVDEAKLLAGDLLRACDEAVDHEIIFPARIYTPTDRLVVQVNPHLTRNKET